MDDGALQLAARSTTSHATVHATHPQCGQSGRMAWRHPVEIALVSRSVPGEVRDRDSPEPLMKWAAGGPCTLGGPGLPAIPR
jgi:hypothetical protein